MWRRKGIVGISKMPALRNKYLHHIYIALTHLLSTNLALNRGHHLKFDAEIPYTNMKYFFIFCHMCITPLNFVV